MDSSAPNRTLRTGEMLNWYRIERVLGRGGFGVIYLATDTNLDHRVAIKEYLPETIARRGSHARVQPLGEEEAELYTWGLERFIGEARNLVRFKHPHIVRVMSVFEANNTAYMVMEFEEGVDLRDYLKVPGRSTETSLKRLIMPVIDGLDEVHRLGFIHRDVKPANILVRRDGTPVLLDFGSARQPGVLTHSQMTALVSVGYAPLEQYGGDGEGDEQQGPWTDIYALGGVLYHAVAGEDPIDSTRRGSALFNGGRDPLVPAHIVGQGRYSEGFLRAIDWALEFRIADRPQTLVDWKPALLSETPMIPFSEPAPSGVVTGLGDHQLAPAVAAAAAAVDLDDEFEEVRIDRRRQPAPADAQRRRRGPRAMLSAGLLLAIVGGGGVWLYSQRDATPEQPAVVTDEVEAAAEQEESVASADAGRGVAAAADRDVDEVPVGNDELVPASSARSDAQRLEDEQRAAAQAAQAAETAEETARLAREASQQKARRLGTLDKLLDAAETDLLAGQLESVGKSLASAGDLVDELGTGNRRLTTLRKRLDKAVAEARIPVSDEEFDSVMQRFDQLRRAIEAGDREAMNYLSTRSSETVLFEQLMDRFTKLNMDITGVRVRNADKSIIATLRIRSMVRSNGDLTTPSDAYRNRDITSRRVNGEWSTISW